MKKNCNARKNNWIKEFDSPLTLGLDSDHLVKYQDVWFENDFALINGFIECKEN
jgi:hypothetical protein